MSGLRRLWVESGEVRLAVLEQGDPQATTVLLVHGYPDNSTVWDGVAERLADRFHVVRYDVRGHGGSEAPASRDGYRIEALNADLRAVKDAVKPAEPVHLVGHDWGSIQCWPALDQRLFRSYTSISGPDLDQIGAWMRGWPRRPGKVARQVAHSWYIGAFQVPVIPELIWRIPWLRRKFHATYRDASNGVQLYRANMGGRLTNGGPRTIDLPVQQVALTQDPYVTKPLLEVAEPWCPTLWRRELAAGHWAPRTDPAAVARLIGEFADHVDGAPPTRELRRARVGVRREEMAGQLALVTGAGSGIGRETALALSAAGAEVLCVDIDFDAAERTAEEAGGLAFQLDVADGTATHKLAEHIATEHGVPDLVMANAGIGVSGSFLDTSEEDWRRVLDVNLWGVIHTLRAFLPRMVERKEGGHVVITSSAAGYVPSPALPAYSTTKAGVLMLAQCLAGELAPHGIGVSAICPGFVHTNITATTRFAGAGPDEEKKLQQRAFALYGKRGYGPEKVAAAVVAAVRENRLVVPVTPEARIGAIGARFAPATTRAIGRWMDTRVAREADS
ncbi:MAG: SDR family oxidoreductase [Actinophytocola sp.]|uniref:SDR family oxidoreductase n=1 Tax=Actinophytocola sp. TaxID=1872138 RepID=UPI0013269703|nr:SDR family oxidoreductase [Actinophytocola sp.]MPZ81601.1 SDR family oxidoreductase [Actinophytocola sp.]